MPTFTPKLDTLPAAQRALWPYLKAVSTLGYVLYGGTAIALRLSHRPSVDFDFFSDRSLDKAVLRAACPFLAQSSVLQDSLDTFTVLTPPISLGHSTVGKTSDTDAIQTGQEGEQIKISFFGGIGFGRIGVPDMTSDGVVQVASLDDLLATKLKVLLQRIEAKDYRDIAALLANGVTLDRGLAGARLLFGPAFQPSECLKALVYFQGGDLETLPLDIQQALISAAAAVGPLPQVALMSHTLAINAG